MALPATGVIEIRATATANNVNGGGFNSARGGTDYTLQDAAQLTGTDLTCTAGSTTVTSASGGFTSQMVGNYMHLPTLTGTGAIVGWYEIVTYTDANNVILDRTPTNGVNNITAGTFYVGGAMSLNSTLDDELFEIGVPGNVFYIRGASGSVTLGESVSIAAAGTGALPITIQGYNSTRGDAPTGSTRPTIAMGANTLTLGSLWNINNVMFTTTSDNGITLGNACRARHCKATNTSTTSNRYCFVSGTNSIFMFCEATSIRGRGWNLTNAITLVFCYAHECDVGILNTNNTVFQLLYCVSESNKTAALRTTGSNTQGSGAWNCTFYGAENKLGVGIDLAAGVTVFRLVNSIICGFVTGVAHADTNASGFDDFNCYYNNTNDVSAAGQWQKGSNDSTANPTFASVAQVTGTAGKFTAGNDRIVDTSKNFSTSGVVANQDYVYIVSGTGATAGIYQITALATTTNPNDTLVLSPAPGTNTTADKVYQITTGHNFAIGTNLKALGSPGAFPGGLSTGYMDIGAVQRQEPTETRPPRIHQIVGGTTPEY